MAEEQMGELSPGDQEMATRRRKIEPEPLPKHQETQLESFFNETRERYEDPKRLPERLQVVTDLIDYLKIEEGEAKKKGDDEHAKALAKMQTAVANSPVDGFDKDYRKEILKHVRQEAEKDNEAGGENQEMFKAFLGYLERPTGRDEANVPEEIKENKEKPEQDQLPEYEYKPGETNQVLEALKDKGEITMRNVKDFMQAAYNDIVIQEKAFKKEHEGLIAAVNEAEEKFKTKYKGENDPNVVIEGHSPDGKTYNFTLNSDLQDPNSLHHYRLRRDEYEIRRSRTSTSLELLQELTRSRFAKITDTEKAYITRIFDLHREYLDELPEEKKEEAKQQEAILDSFSDLLEKRVKADGGAKRFFNGVSKLKQRFKSSHGE